MIRALTSKDYSQWHMLWSNYLAFYETELDEAIFKGTFQKLISKNNPSQNALVSEDDSALNGLVHFIAHPHNWKSEHVVYLQDLYTDVDMRGKGIGRALIEAVYKIADENDTPTVYWLTQDHNHVARHLYDRIGTLTPFIKYNR
jgi:ribosomal protein S18 acetylase RimI-like enzyme